MQPLCIRWEMTGDDVCGAAGVRTGRDGVCDATRVCNRGQRCCCFFTLFFSFLQTSFLLSDLLAYTYVE